MRFLLVAVFVIFLSVHIMAEERAVQVIPNKIRNENRVALVIGNKDYTSLNSLKNPINDARDMAEILRAKGFYVIPLENASQMQMEQAIAEFSNKIQSGKGVGLFYYAGHGVEVNGVNYLIPSDAQIPSIDFVKSKTVSVDSILSAMQRANNRFNILILDACRSNPFGRGGGGLAPINNATGVFVAYATAPGKIAEDGAESNGLFTKYLKQYINKSGLKIEEVFKSVGREVQKASQKRQTPWTSSSVYGDFYFTLPNIKQKQQTNNVTPISNTSNNKSNKIWALKKACDLNNALGCKNLGVMYELGKGISKNEKKAIKLYTKACHLNNALGCKNLGVMYEFGKGISKDLNKAKEFFKKACDLNNAEACNNLSKL